MRSQYCAFYTGINITLNTMKLLKEFMRNYAENYEGINKSITEEEIEDNEQNNE